MMGERDEKGGDVGLVESRGREKGVMEEKRRKRGKGKIFNVM